MSIREKNTIRIPGRVEKLARWFARYARFDLIQPATPRFVALMKSFGEKTRNEDDQGESYGLTNTPTEFVDHWFKNEWTIPRLVKAYRKLRMCAITMYAGIAVTASTCVIHSVRALGEVEFQPLFTGTSLFILLIFLLAGLQYSMYCWRIRNHRINARLWLAEVRKNPKELWPARLPESYLADLKSVYEGKN